MRSTQVRLLLMTATILAVGGILLSANAADPSDDEFKALLEQDIKAITKAAAAGATAKNKATPKNASNGIKSSALIVAAYSNARIAGKDPAADAKAAGIRDEAIKLFKAGADKDFKAAAEIAKGLATAKPAAKAAKIDVTKAFGELTSKEVMDNFLKSADQFGTNVEADIKALGNPKKKLNPKPGDIALIVHRVLVMGDLSKTVTKTTNAAEKKEWDDYNTKMIAAAEDLLAVAQKKPTAADLAKAFTKLDSTCNACHDVFKKTD